MKIQSKILVFLLYYYFVINSVYYLQNSKASEYQVELKNVFSFK